MPHKIVVGVDGSEASARALRWAADEARRRAEPLDVVMAWQPHYPVGLIDPGTPVGASLSEMDVDMRARQADTIDSAGQADIEQRIGAMVAELGDDAAGLTVTRHAVRGHAAEALIRYAEGCDLLVVGTRGRGGFKELFLGSVSHQVATHAPCPVVIVPGPPGERRSQSHEGPERAHREHHLLHRRH